MTRAGDGGPKPAPQEPAPQEPGTQEPAPFGPGTLVLVVGPSGAGKDTVIGAARASLGARARVHFARRLVTRPEGAGEQHGTVTEDEFAARRAAGEFPLFWRAHGLGYALGPEVGQEIRAGGLVVANGSRETLADARARFDVLKVVLVTAPVPVRAARLKARGRERDAEIAARLARDPPLVTPPDLVIENVGPAQEAGLRLARFIQDALDAQRP